MDHLLSEFSVTFQNLTVRLCADLASSSSYCLAFLMLEDAMHDTGERIANYGASCEPSGLPLRLILSSLASLSLFLLPSSALAYSRFPSLICDLGKVFVVPSVAIYAASFLAAGPFGIFIRSTPRSKAYPLLVLHKLTELSHPWAVPSGSLRCC